MSDLEHFEELFRTVGIKYNFFDLIGEWWYPLKEVPNARYGIQLDKGLVHFGLWCNFYFDENKKFLNYAVEE